MHIVVTARPDRDGIVRAMRHARRKPVLRVRLLCLGYVVVGVALLFVWNLYTFLIAYGCFIAAVLTQLAQWLTYRAALRRNLAFFAVPRTVTLTDEGVELATQHTSSRLAWRVLRGVDLMPGLMIIFITAQKFWVVPTDGLTGEEIGEITAALSRVPWARETMTA